MPQEIRVLKCFTCQTYQVDIAKKTNKWQCKLCGVKQSLRREYFRGTGPECRLKAQELNMHKGQQQENEERAVLELLDDETFDWNIEEENQNNSVESKQKVLKLESKWAKFTESPCSSSAEARNNEGSLNFSNTQKWKMSTGSENITRLSASSTKRKHKLETFRTRNGSAKMSKSKWGAYI